MSAHATELIPATQHAAPTLAGADQETRAVWGFLARYANDHTRENYRHDIEQFARWVRTACDLPTMLTAQRMHVELYLRHLQRTGYAQASVARKFGVVKQFYKYAVIDELVAKDPTVHIDRPPVDTAAQRRTRLTTLQYSQLLHHIRLAGDRRVYAMVVCMGMMGLRIAEMCSLNVDDVARSVGQATVTFTGKGTKRFTLDLPLEVLSAFDVIAAGRLSGPLFLNRAGTGRWQANSARRALYTAVRHAGLGDVDITPHGLRRTGASTLAERGVELGAIQEWCRHADPRVTKLAYIGSDSGAGTLARQTLATIYSNVAR